MNIFSNKSVVLPAFVATNPLNAATIRWQRCYTAASKFVFRMPVRVPSGGWVLCVRDRAGLSVRRFKLWTQTTAGVYMPTVADYAGEVIYPEFVLEVWSLPGVVPVMSTDLELLTTLGYSGECSDRTDLEPANSDTFEQEWNSNVL